jgi:hypothetical protein
MMLRPLAGGGVAQDRFTAPASAFQFQCAAMKARMSFMRANPLSMP